jgi:hypothetical protein
MVNDENKRNFIDHVEIVDAVPKVNDASEDWKNGG